MIIIVSLPKLEFFCFLDAWEMLSKRNWSVIVGYRTSFQNPYKKPAIVLNMQW